MTLAAVSGFRLEILVDGQLIAAIDRMQSIVIGPAHIEASFAPWLYPGPALEVEVWPVVHVGAHRHPVRRATVPRGDLLVVNWTMDYWFDAPGHHGHGLARPEAFVRRVREAFRA